MHDARNYCIPVLYIQSTQPYLYITVQIQIQKIHLYVYFPALLLDMHTSTCIECTRDPYLARYEALDLVDTGWVSAFYWVGVATNPASACHLAALLLSASGPLRGGP